MLRLRQLKANKAIKNIETILNANLGVQMAKRPRKIEAAATWPDDVRSVKEYGFAANLHFVSIPVNDAVDKDKYVKATMCRASNKVPQVPEGVCIVGALEHYRNVLASSVDKKARLEALSFIVHFMGDLHQPLHTSEKQFEGKGDMGGNLRLLFYLDEALFNGDENSCFENTDACTETFKNENQEDELSNRKLHAAWDKYMIRDQMRASNKSDFKKYAKLLFESPQNSTQIFADFERGDIIEWAEEAHDLAEKNAYNLVGPKPKISPADNVEHRFFLLNEAYRTKNTKIVESQLLKGGIRLANFLSKIFPENS
jgi:hypothetical protein